MTTIYAPAPMLPTITPWHWDSIEADIADTASGSIVGTSVVWPASSLALFVPFVLQQRVLIGQLFTSNGGATGDSSDLGIYTDDFRRLVSTGLQAQTGTTTLQKFTVTAVGIGPGRFYMAMCVNGTTSAYIQRAMPATFLQAAGCFQVDLSGESTPGTLPTTVTPATIANAYLPVFGIGLNGFTF